MVILLKLLEKRYEFVHYKKNYRPLVLKILKGNKTVDSICRTVGKCENPVVLAHQALV
jgi:hypothetical protein